MTDASATSFAPRVLLLEPDLLLLLYGSTISAPFTVKSTELKGSPLTLKFAFPPPTLGEFLAC